MRNLIRWLAAMPVAIGLLVLIILALAAGTIVESASGSAAAAAAVYGTLWFRALLGLFAINVLASLVDRWPWGWARAGFLLTHGAMLLILAGALMTWQMGIGGRLALWEGEESSLFVEDASGGPGRFPRSLPLPFSVRLDAFEIDTYPGTRRPAMFRSRVVVTDPDTGDSFPAVIEMNRELSYRGYKLFQSSYKQTPGRDQTVLAVSRDPGQWVVFTGYTLLVLGMITVLVTRVMQQRALTRAAERRPSRVARAARQVAAIALLLAIVAPGPAVLAQEEHEHGPQCAHGAPAPGGHDPSHAHGGGGAPASPPPARSPAALEPWLETLRRIPVQHDGRVMPLDTLAREGVWQVTGRARFLETDPVAIALAWAFDPVTWANRPLVAIGDADLAEEIDQPRGARHASFNELVTNGRLIALLGQAHAEAQADRPVRGLLKEARELEGRLLWLQGFLDGTLLRVVPAPPGAENPTGQWSAPEHVHSVPELMAASKSGLEAASAETGWRGTAPIEREVLYNRVRPSRLSWWILLAATAASMLAWTSRRRWLDGIALAGLVAGFGVMTWGIAVRWQIAGRIPASNMYESLLFLAWGVGLFAMCALLVLRNRLVVFNAAAMAALTMVLADCLPIDPYIHPMPPVLSGTAWLAIHVPIIMVSYSVLALGVLIAHIQVGLALLPRRREKTASRAALSARIGELLYYYIHIGSILLIAGILTGSIWAASSWGRYWGWDPKEVWSLIAFLAYLAILHGRFDRLIGPFGVALASIVAFWTIVMTYIGVNYILAAGLHSYGFGSSGVVRWLLLVAGAEALFLGAGLLAHRRGAGGGRGLPAPA